MYPSKLGRTRAIGLIGCLLAFLVLPAASIYQNGSVLAAAPRQQTGEGYWKLINIKTDSHFLSLGPDSSFTPAFTDSSNGGVTIWYGTNTQSATCSWTVSGNKQVLLEGQTLSFTLMLKTTATASGESGANSAASFYISGFNSNINPAKIDQFDIPSKNTVSFQASSSGSLVIPRLSAIAKNKIQPITFTCDVGTVGTAYTYWNYQWVEQPTPTPEEEEATLTPTLGTETPEGTTQGGGNNPLAAILAAAGVAAGVIGALLAAAGLAGIVIDNRNQGLGPEAGGSGPKKPGPKKPGPQTPQLKYLVQPGSTYLEVHPQEQVPLGIQALRLSPEGSGPAPEATIQVIIPASPAGLVVSPASGLGHLDCAFSVPDPQVCATLPVLVTASVGGLLRAQAVVQVKILPLYELELSWEESPPPVLQINGAAVRAWARVNATPPDPDNTPDALAGQITVSVQGPNQEWIQPNPLTPVIQNGVQWNSIAVVSPTPGAKPQPGKPALVAQFTAGKQKLDARLPVTLSCDFVIEARSGDARIIYQANARDWQVPTLITYFTDPGTKTPRPVSFPYQFQEPKLTFDTDIIDIVECFTEDDGLTYEFKLALKPNTNLEDYFGEDLTQKNGQIKVSVVAVDDKQNPYPASMVLQVAPQLRMVAYSYNQNVKTRARERERRSPYKGLVLEDMEFIADSLDKLPLVFFFIRSDKQVKEGAEADAVMDMVEVQTFDWTTAAFFDEPEVNTDHTGGGFFAYDLCASDAIAPDKEKVYKTYNLQVHPRIQADGHSNYSFEGEPLIITVKPQFVWLRLWVVPGYARGTSEAIAYAKLLPSLKPFSGLTLTLETTGGGTMSLNPSGGWNQVTQEQDIPLKGHQFTYKLMKGTARWILTYSGLTWSSLPEAQFQVTCKGPEGKTGPTATAMETFDVNANVTAMLSDLLHDPDIQSELTNPYFNNSSLPYFMRGQVWNIYCKLQYYQYVCQYMRDKIINYLQQRRGWQADGDFNARLASMRGMNGIEFEKYHIFMVHVWAGFFLSGMSSGDYKALDPWWEQRWNDPSLSKPENLMTEAGEALNFSKEIISVGVIVTAAASALAGAGIVVAGSQLTALIGALIAGTAATTAIETAGMADVGFSGVIELEPVVYPDGKLKFDINWLTEFIPKLDEQDQKEWKKQ